VAAAYGAIVSEGADARNFAMVALITLGALVLSGRADRSRVPLLAALIAHRVRSEDHSADLVQRV